MLEKTVLLPLPAERAFHLFTDRISEWWPASHRLTKDPQSSLHFEPSGRFYERATDGREVELGHILAWEPPHRLALDFYIGTNAAQPTALEVTFTSEGAGTRVTVQHRPKSESQGLWETRAPRFASAWDTLLASLAAR